MTRVSVSRALVSVYDKTGVVEFARRLVAAGVEIVSSGGTATTLRDAGVEVVGVSAVTGAPEILGGRVKTLHPAIHGGILADHRNPNHVAELAAHGIAGFQLVVVNLYPFEATVADPDASSADIIEKIDIGGPAMTRAAAKNHGSVGVVTDPDQYDEVADAVAAGGLDDELRRRLAAAAFFRTAEYDAAIVGWMNSAEALAETMVLPLRRERSLRYGENPHQDAALYRLAGSASWWAGAKQLQGKEMSFNNMADAEAAWRLVNDLPDPSVAIIKHTNACGVAVRPSMSEAFDAAWDCDPISAFGGVVAINRTLDGATAQRIAERFVEIVIAPAIEMEATEVLASRKNLRLIEAPPPAAADLDIRGIEGGFLIQARDVVEVPDGWKVVSDRQPTADQMAALRLCWTVAAHTKSNAVVVGSGAAAVGVGAGDQSRVGAAERAVARAGDRAVGGVAASDAFFPFRDGLDVLVDAGVAAIIEPGGSVRDDELIEAANERGVVLVFTGQRHFRH